MKTPFLYIFIITSAITLSGALNLNASPSSAEERNDSSEKIASASAAGETQKLLSEEILSQLDLLEISDLLEINGQYNKKRFLNSQKGLVPDDYLAAAEEKVNQQLDKQKNRNIKTQIAYQAYELLSDKMSSISTNELRSYLAEQLDSFQTINIYTPTSGWESNHLLRFKRTQKLFHFVANNDPNLLAMIPHFEKHLTTNTTGSLYLAVGGLIKTGTNGYPILMNAMTNQSIGLQSVILQGFAEYFCQPLKTPFIKEKTIFPLWEDDYPKADPGHLHKKALQYLQNPPDNPFSEDDPCWLPCEARNSIAHCSAIIILKSIQHDLKSTEQIITALALYDPDPIVRCTALQAIQSASSTPQSLFSRNLRSQLTQIANDEKELSSIRYRAKSMLIHPYRWNPEISHPTSYPTFCYPFYGTYIFIP